MELSKALIEDLAEVAYIAYCQGLAAMSGGWLDNFDRWNQLPEGTREAWRRVAVDLTGATKNAQTKQLLEAQNEQSSK